VSPAYTMNKFCIVDSKPVRSKKKVSHAVKLFNTWQNVIGHMCGCDIVIDYVKGREKKLILFAFNFMR
jgi:hypothetical protein